MIINYQRNNLELDVVHLKLYDFCGRVHLHGELELGVLDRLLD
jgi:hypothetical protein